MQPTVRFAPITAMPALRKIVGVEKMGEEVKHGAWPNFTVVALGSRACFAGRPDTNSEAYCANGKPSVAGTLR